MKNVKVVLALLCILLCLGLTACGKNDKTDEEKQEEKEPTPAFSFREGKLTGNPTISQLLSKSNPETVVFYLTEENPSADSEVTAVLAFEQGKVTVYDRSTIVSKYEDCTVGKVMQIDRGTLLKELEETRSEQSRKMIGPWIESAPELAGELAVYRKTQEKSENLDKIFFCGNTSVKKDFYLLAYSDAQNAELQKEVLYVPETWIPFLKINQEGVLLSGNGTYKGGKKLYVDNLLEYPEGDVDTTDDDALLHWQEWYEAASAEQKNDSDTAYRNLGAIEIDITLRWSGTISETDFVGFSAGAKGSVITMCAPETKIDPDTVKTAELDSAVILNPQKAAEARVRYLVNRMIRSELVNITEIEEIGTYADGFLTEENAEKLFAKGEYDTAIKMMRALEIDEAAVKAKEYEAAKMLLQLGEEKQEQAYELLRDSGHSNEIPRDCGGLEVTLCDWYSTAKWDAVKYDYDKAFFDMLHKAEEEYHFTFERVSPKGGYYWGDSYIELVVLSVRQNEPVGSLVLADNRWIGSLISNGVLLDVTNVSTVNWDDDKWNRAVLDVMTINGHVYGFAADTEARTGVFFNKKIFRKFGIDENLLYDLQKEGKWNWEVFLEVCKSLTKDTNNDGKTDIYAVCGQDYIVADAALQSNGTFVIEKDESGLLKLNADDPAVMQSLKFVQDLHELGYFMPKPNTNVWDWFKPAFRNGKAAMRIEEAWAASDIRLSVEFGFVSFPYGPSVGKPISVVRENVLFVPNCPKNAMVIEDIMYAYNWYTTVPEGYEEDPIRWKRSYIGDIKDKRALDESIRYMMFDYPGYMSPSTLIPNYNYFWTGQLENGMTAQQIIDAYSDSWQSETEIFNTKFR